MANTNKSILVIEDDTVLLWTITRTLANEGFTVYKATAGDAGLELALREHPHLILLDIILPKMDGFTVLKQLRQDSWGKDVPILILTNLSQAETAKEIEALNELNCECYVKANINPKDVVRKIKTKLAPKQ